MPQVKMSTGDSLDDFEMWLAMQGPENEAEGVAVAGDAAAEGQQKQEQAIEQRNEVSPKADDGSESSDVELGEFKDPAQMTLEQLEETQKIYLRRLEREDLEEGECPEQEDSAAQKERSLTRRQDLQILRAVNNRSTALQRLQVERLQKLAKKTNGGDQCLNDRIDQWLDDSCRDRGKLSKKDKRLQEVAKVRLRASDIYSDSSSDSSASSEADDNEDSQKCKPTTASPTLLSTLDELHDVVLTRSQLIDFVDKPIFEQTVIDCFVHMPSHKPQSKVYQIIGLLQSRKTYQLGNKTTDYMLRLRHAKLESTARLDAVCDSPVEPEAFENWIESCQQAYCTLPELSLLAKKQKDIEKATNYQFTEEDVAEIVKKKRESGQRKEKVAVLKIRLIEQRDLALTNNDQEEVARLESEIEEIDRDQEKSRYGYSRHQQGLRFGGSLRTGLTPYVPKIVLPKSQHRREAALVPAIPHRHKPARRGPVVVAARPIPAAAPPDTDADALTADEPYIPRFLKMADKAKASGRPAIAAVARLPKPLLAKRSFAESAPKPEDAELEHFMKRKYQKSAIGMRSREADDAADEVPEVVAPHEPRKNPSSNLFELHDFQVDVDTSALGLFDSMMFGERPAADPASGEPEI